MRVGSYSAAFAPHGGINPLSAVPTQMQTEYSSLSRTYKSMTVTTMASMSATCREASKVSSFVMSVVIHQRSSSIVELCSPLEKEKLPCEARGVGDGISHFHAQDSIATKLTIGPKLHI